ncbi:hypothetical protein G6F56_002177 [Rhizopus delemar]|nr:hypothetical protein G6F56_002177 [Rhizopus delemar]
MFSDRAKSAITCAFRSAPFLPITTQHQLFIAGGVEWSYSTFRRRMLDLGFSSYSPARNSVLSDRHKRNHLHWCQDKVDWTIDQWKSVVWSNKPSYTVVGNDGVFRVVRKEGERYLEQHILETHKFGKDSIMLWYGRLGPLATLTGNIEQDAYVNCLSQNFRPWYEELHRKAGKNFLFQEDDAPCHTGAYATWYKNNRCEADSFNFWPAQSPDVNPIEHLWAYISYKPRSKRCEIGNVLQLEDTIRKIWNSIPSIILENVVTSMPARCHAVIEAIGGHTKY